jgi:hypothetical protein
MSDHEDTQLRFYLAAQLMRMPYGWSRVIEGDKVRRAWKPTGDHDRSFEAAFRAMALASGGHRPEESYTTDERIKKDLDSSFIWHLRAEDGDYVFHRRDKACPKCRGWMRIRKLGRVPLPRIMPSEIPKMSASVIEEWTECDMHGKGREAE